MKLLTPRLELICATLEIVTADLHRRDQLPVLLKAPIARGWPPPLIDVRAMERHRESFLADPTSGGWTSWYWILRHPRAVVGISGFKSKPKNGVVEIGYTMLPQFHRRGLATEAVAAMVRWAFANGAQLIFAETLPELIASQRVLLKNNFRRVAEASEPGVVRFARRS